MKRNRDRADFKGSSGLSPDQADPSPDAMQELLSKAVGWVEEARSIILEAVSQGFSHRLKRDRSFVTDVDLAVEKHLRGRIESQFPGHGIYGEEYGREAASAGAVWVVDPIDGTQSFVHGIPLYGTLLALLVEGEPRLGIIDLPGLDRRYMAARGSGAYCNDRRLWIRDLQTDDPIDGEVISAGERRQFEATGTAELFDRLMQLHPSVRTYCDCFGHSLAVEGAVGAMLDFHLRLWDLAATQVLISEAGGRFVKVGAGEDQEGNPIWNVVFGKPSLVQWILDQLNLKPLE